VALNGVALNGVAATVTLNGVALNGVAATVTLNGVALNGGPQPGGPNRLGAGFGVVITAPGLHRGGWQMVLGGVLSGR
jgi:hypothetical protein